MAKTQTDRRRYRALCAKLGLTDDERRAALSPYGVDSSTLLGAAQLRELCDALQRELDRKKDPGPTMRRLRSSVLGLLQLLGVLAPGPNPDWARVNAYLENPRIAGKRLYALDEAELKALIPRLQAVLSKHRDKIENENRLAAQN